MYNNRPTIQASLALAMLPDVPTPRRYSCAPYLEN